jgi:hypothetical protein
MPPAGAGRRTSFPRAPGGNRCGKGLRVPTGSAPDGEGRFGLGLPPLAGVPGESNTVAEIGPEGGVDGTAVSAAGAAGAAAAAVGAVAGAPLPPLAKISGCCCALLAVAVVGPTDEVGASGVPLAPGATGAGARPSVPPAVVGLGSPLSFCGSIGVVVARATGSLTAAGRGCCCAMGESGLWPVRSISRRRRASAAPASRCRFSSRAGAGGGRGDKLRAAERVVGWMG